MTPTGERGPDDPTADTLLDDLPSSLDVVERPDERAPDPEPDPTAPPTDPVSRRRRRAMLIGAVLGVVALAAGTVAAIELQSGDSSRTEPDVLGPGIATAQVELRALTARVTVIGDVAASGDAVVTVSGAPDGPGVVTATGTAAGATVDEGDVLAEVDGRPIFLIGGATPVFRDLGPGDEGTDVGQLQEALIRLGVLTGEPTGVFDAATQAAMAELYTAAGYESLGPSDDDLVALDAARTAVDDAQRALNDAEIRVSEAGDDLPTATILQLDADVAAAQAAVTAARSDAADALAGPQAALTEAERVRDEIAATVTELERRLASAQRRLDDGTDADGDPLSQDQLAELADEVAALGTELEGQREVAGVSRAVVAQRAAEVADVRRRTDDVIRAAEARLGAARAARSAANSAPDTSAQRAAVADAEEVLRRAQEALTELERSVGPRWPADELVALDDLPRTVRSVADVGSPADGEIVVVANGEVTVRATVPPSDRELLDVGLVARLLDDQLGIDADAEVVSLADEPGTSTTDRPVDADRFEITVRSVGSVPDVPPSRRIRIEIPVAETRGEVFVVPVAALAAGLDDTTRITVIAPDGSTRSVRVVAGLVADGLVTVDPVGDELTTNDRVVIGADRTAEPVVEDGP
ncbi:MAG: peptidoglycan-binding domain-containing protein [Actinomycetota bacterium]